MRARSTSGTTVSSKPTMPGRLGSPRPRRASRLARISALTGRKVAPLARSAPRVVGRGAGGLRGDVRHLSHGTTRSHAHPVTGLAAPGLPGSAPWPARRALARSVSGADVEAAAALLDGRRPADTRWSTPAGWPSGSAARCGSSARTCSAPARSRSAAPTPGSPGSTDEERARGVVAASAGNHAQGVALAASCSAPGRRSSCRRARRCPRWRPPGPTARRCGFAGRRWPRRCAPRPSTRSATGAIFIHPFDHPDVIAGQGTVGLEMLEQCPEVATVVVGAGGGGLGRRASRPR